MYPGCPPGRRRFIAPVCVSDPFTERSKQGVVYRVGLRAVFGMPLDAQRETGRGGNSDGLERAVICHAPDDDAIRRLRNALTMERVYAGRLPVEKSREDTAGNESVGVAVRERFKCPRPQGPPAVRNGLPAGRRAHWTPIGMSSCRFRPF